MQNITIIGLGLIGGSIGLALKRWSAENGNALKITGFDSDMQHQELARKMNLGRLASSRRVCRPS